jgi:hypothetical protein
MSVDTAHKLIVLARRTSVIATDLGMFAGTAHSGDDNGLRTQLAIMRAQLDAVAGALGKIEDGLNEEVGG